MATYAIGDIQGCRRELDDLLELLAFGSQDRLWLVGDLVNRGADSAGVMERVLSLAEQVTMVLGNHDLHMLAIHFAGHKPSRSDTFHDVLAHPHVDEFAAYLCQQPLIHHDAGLGWTMTHAGLPHIWSLDKAVMLGEEVRAVLRDEHYDVSRSHFFENMYGNKPSIWHEELSGMGRVKLITNYFTRMRLIKPDGELDFLHKGALDTRPPGWTPWYELAQPAADLGNLVFGHWAALQGQTSQSHIHAIDTGCVYGRRLTALRLEDATRFSIPASAA